MDLHGHKHSRTRDRDRTRNIDRSKSRDRDIEHDAPDIIDVSDLSNVIGLPKKLYRKHRLDLIYPQELGPSRHAYVINLAELHRLNLQALRRDLGAAATEMSRDENLSDKASDEQLKLMTKYCE